MGIKQLSSKIKLIRTNGAKLDALIQHMLDKGMNVWVCMSDDSYDAARAKIGRYAYRITGYDADNNYPVRDKPFGWKYAVPIDTATMTEIMEVPKYDNLS